MPFKHILALQTWGQICTVSVPRHSTCDRRAYFVTEIGKSLVTLTIAVISISFAENVDQIDECGNLDYTVLKPVLERAKADDLMRIEEYNPKLMDDTGEYKEKLGLFAKIP